MGSGLYLSITHKQQVPDVSHILMGEQVEVPGQGAGIPPT